MKVSIQSVAMLLSSTATATSAFFVVPPHAQPQRTQSQRRRAQQQIQQQQQRKNILESPSISTRLNLNIDGKTIDGGMEKFKPNNNYLLLKNTGTVDATEGGLLLTGKAKNKKTQGLVISVGPGRTDDETGTYYPMPVDVDDTVLYAKSTGMDITIDKEKHLIIMDSDILAQYKAGGPIDSIDNAEMIRDNVLVEIPEAKSDNEASPSGILLAKSSTTEKRPSIGTVVKVGPGKPATNGEMMPMEVEVGDMIKFRDFAGTTVEIGKKEYSV
eukprot:CAMPEP_0119567162 /NCGR_PEP_ID=MMETSP1352-20130426/35162_1 /TAXON_ID=265584 /ORGANISM="Stauroneis constricta, Strain CCMP1120" /LENGTH=270 /DNA_ID=CAMNT_0007616379 /DNA_START=67 /DNA_END=875 /DNA_ORIENTATION=-